VRARPHDHLLLYLPESAVAGITFRKSYALLDGLGGAILRRARDPAEYREINDINLPRAKDRGCRAARRRGFVLHHTTIAHSMDIELVPR